MPIKLFELVEESKRPKAPVRLRDLEEIGGEPLEGSGFEDAEPEIQGDELR